MRNPAFTTGYAVAPAPARKLFRACKEKCPGRRACNCTSDVTHTLHICSEPTCYCHSRQRYEGTPKP